MKFKDSKLKVISWNEEKNNLLKAKRGLGFEMVEELISENKIIDILEHPNKNYQHQKIFIVKLKGYLCKVPFVETEDEIFLKTIFPDRRLKKFYE